MLGIKWILLMVDNLLFGVGVLLNDVIVMYVWVMFRLWFIIIFLYFFIGIIL